MKYSDSQRKEAVRSRLQSIVDSPPPDYPEPRKKSYMAMNVNSIKTTVILEPYRCNITQWVVTINGKKITKPMGMNRVYRELAKLNPPARNFY